jgi:hypothetical protein
MIKKTGPNNKETMRKETRNEQKRRKEKCNFDREKSVIVLSQGYPEFHSVKNV